MQSCLISTVSEENILSQAGPFQMPQHHEIIQLSILGCDQQNLEKNLLNFKWAGHRLAHVFADAAPEAWWGRVFDLCTPLLFDLYQQSEQNGYFELVPEHAPGSSIQVLPGCRVRHPLGSKKVLVRVGQQRHTNVK